MLHSDELIVRRALLKLNQAKFADVLGISREQLSRVETSNKPVSKQLEKQYKKLFGRRLLIDILKNGGDMG